MRESERASERACVPGILLMIVLNPLQRCSPLIHACKEVEVSQEKRQQTVEFLLEKGASALPRNESKVHNDVYCL